MHLLINGARIPVKATPDVPLLWVLRDLLAMTGTKFGCGIAQCGACTVHVDDQPVRACQLPVGMVGERAITTIEAMPMGLKQVIPAPVSTEILPDGLRMTVAIPPGTQDAVIRLILMPTGIGENELAARLNDRQTLHWRQFVLP